MILDEVRSAVSLIKRFGMSPAVDHQRAHTLEDYLYLMILQAVARGEDDPDLIRQCAQEALKTQEIEFQRWCA